VLLYTSMAIKKVSNIILIELHMTAGVHTVRRNHSILRPPSNSVDIKV
jgi:hypothetical protein